MEKAYQNLCIISHSWYVRMITEPHNSLPCDSDLLKVNEIQLRETPGERKREREREMICVREARSDSFILNVFTMFTLFTII